MKGIISHLASVCGGDAHEKSEVILDTSSVHNNGGIAKWEMNHAVDHKIDPDFGANNNAMD
jgi:hypothetical protein